MNATELRGKTPDELRTARVPDGDRWLYGVGATARLTDSLQMDAALAYISFDESRINHDTTFYEGTPAATTTRLRGTVNGNAGIISLGLRKTFLGGSGGRGATGTPSSTRAFTSAGVAWP